jgi:broad specificity phosphatase PhoE
MRTIYFITHPDVEIDPAIPVPEWRLSTRGRKRMHSLLNQPWVRHLSAVWCSTERKANDGAEIIANAIGKVPLHLATLGENDRSATGYLPKAEFEAAADAFFAQSHDSVRGWETAIDAQRRIIEAVAIVAAASPRGDVAIVSHGGVGALLLCWLKACPISRAEDQPSGNGGHYFCFDRHEYTLKHGWTSIDDPGL